MMPAMPAFLMSFPAGLLRWTLCGLAVATMLLAAPEIYTAAWRAAKARSTNMNTLVALGTLAAFAESFAATVAPGWFVHHGVAADVYYEAIVLILAFLLCGRWLEDQARKRATASVRGFAGLESKNARWIAGANERPDHFNTAAETVLPLDAVEVGDFLRVLAGERVPVDGVIVEGTSSLDLSMLTGESLPVTMHAGDLAAGGSLNLDGMLIVQATAIGTESTVAQIRRLLEQAQSGRASMQRIADRASAVFVPVVIGLSVLCLFVWMFAGEGFPRALSVAISVLIVACPCAMGLAVPAAMAVAVGRAAQLGLLMKGGPALERLAVVNRIALDKTGTLTLGHPTVAEMRLAEAARFEAATLLTWVVALEQASNHPLAQALLAFAKERGATAAAASDVTVVPGVGVTGRIDGHTVAIGNHSPVAGKGLDEEELRTPVYLVVDNVLQSTFLLGDEIRVEAAATVRELKELGVRPVLLTGDIEASAKHVAALLGIDDVRAHRLPAEKVQAIVELQAAGDRVAMAGDGINDAAAMAQADASLAMAGGTDLAREAGDVLLLQANLRLIPLAIRISRQTLRVMRQNLGWALLYNVLALPVAMGVLYPHWHILLSPVVASAAMALSSVSVLLNSLRLRRLGAG
jgi:Cu+-exporting ATPase